jgi:CHAT domain-containing protein
MASREVELGPLLDLMRAVQEGSIGTEAAKEAARDHGRRREVTPQQVAGLASASLNYATEGQWRRALPVAELAHEAALAAHTAHPDVPAFAEAWLAVGADLVEILHWALFEQGDIRMYLRAKEIADSGIGAAEKLGFPRLQGLLALRFGALVLDAYTANRSPSNLAGQFDAWVARALQGNDPELKLLLSRRVGADGEPSEAVEPPSWPDAPEGLDIAESYLRAALPLVIPERRGRTLKAIVQALEWRGLLGGTMDAAELRNVAQQALDELDPEDEARLAVMATLQRLGETAAEDELVRRLEYDWAGFLAETEEPAAWDAVGQAASMLQNSDPRRAAALLKRRRELSRVWADETLRARHFENELLLFSRAFGPDGLDPFEGDLDQAAGHAVTTAGAAGSPAAARQAAAAIVGIMLASTGKDREALGLGLVDRLFALDQTLWGEHEDAVAALVAGLLRGEGVNHMRTGDVDAAGRYYRQAAQLYRDIRMPSAMVQCLEYIDDVVLSGTTELDELTAWLAAESLAIELAAPSSAPPVLQALAAHLLAAQVSSGTSPEAVQLLLQVIKGRRFAAMLAHGTDDFDFDDYTRYLLSREAEAEAALPADSDVLRPVPFDAAMGDDDIVTAWVDEFETGPSETPADRVANLQRAAEQQLTATLVPDSVPEVTTLAEVRTRLDDHTAVLQIYEGPWVDNSLATWQVLITRDLAEVAVGQEQMPHATVRASWQGRTVTIPASGFYVGALRRAVQADPDPLDISTEGDEALAGAAERYLRVVNANREELPRIDRLVVVPHGSSRYVPIHLAGPPGQPLADSYVVTYLLNLAQLTVDPRPAPRRNGVGVFALSYADQPRLPPLEDSAEEASAIAEVCGATPVLDAKATEAAFKHALETCRYVHLRAHGRLYVDAPSFHTVFLHPADADDGRLRAYEIFRLNLTGLELVTLGACETALGRVDRSDNPRGLPAALLLAGARSVIGTLWPVLAGASNYFFTELYRTLMTGDGDVTAAFASAQRATRKDFPQYRDWGAFYLIGCVAHDGQP